MTEYNYTEVAERLEANQLVPESDYPAIMALLGREVQVHGRMGWACRKVGASHWVSMPRFDSADDAELWLRGEVGWWNDLSKGGTEALPIVAGYEHPEFGNDYGYGKRLGTAMWAAWLRVVAQVPAE